MEQLLNRATAISELAYLRVLQLVHIQTCLLIDDLKGHELPSTTPKPSDIESRRAMAGTSVSSQGTSAAVSSMLEAAMEELFVPYTEGQRYLERESRNLVALYSRLLANFTRFHVSAFWSVISGCVPEIRAFPRRKPRRGKVLSSIGW
jgi:exocyst complex component 5